MTKALLNKTIIFVHSLDSNHMLFSHQRDIVEGLALSSRQTIVISSDIAFPKLRPEIATLRWPWESRHKYISSLKYFLRGLILLIKNRDANVVYIQVDHISALLSPVCFLLRVPNYLWYAHGYKSWFLKLSMPFLTNVFTANRESCSIDSPKLKIVGHYVNDFLFSLSGHEGDRNYSEDFFHLGRSDRSKRISVIGSAVDSFGSAKKTVNLFLLGKPSNSCERQAHEKTMFELRKTCKNLNVIEMGQFNRSELPAQLKNLGIFVHAFQGSLDKAILEATLMKNPVATINKGYLLEFGQWSKTSSNDDVEFLIDEIAAIRNCDKQQLAEELIRRRNIVLANHSLGSWLKTVTRLMKEDQKLG